MVNHVMKNTMAKLLTRNYSIKWMYEWDENRGGAAELEETETIPCTIADKEDMTTRCLIPPYHIIKNDKNSKGIEFNSATKSKGTINKILG